MNRPKVEEFEFLEEYAETLEIYCDQLEKALDKACEELEKCEHVDHVSGMGMMIGVTLKGKALMDVVEGCVDHGVLVLTANGLLRLLPPLNIPWDELKEAIGIVKKVIDK